MDTETVDAETDQAEQQDAPDAGDYPESTPTSEMTDAEKAAFYKSAARKWERRAKADDRVSRDDYDAVKKRLDEISRTSESDNEKAVREAREEGASQAREEVFADTAAALLRMGLRANGVTDDDDLSEIVSFANLSAFRAEDGSIDEPKLESFVKRNAPKAPKTWPDMGQNKPGQRKPESGVAAGAERYRATHQRDT